MKYLISGGNGFIGSFLKDFLEKNGDSVKSIGRSEINDYCIDLSCQDLQITEQFDTIIHTASIVHNDSHNDSLDSILLKNDILITLNFLKSIRNVPYTKLIFLSSVSVYGLDEGINIPISTIPDPKNGYGLSKLISEKIFTNNIPDEKLLILRLPLVNGIKAKGNIKRVRDYIENRRMILFKRNPAKKSFLEVDDLCNFIVHDCKDKSGIHFIKSYDKEFNEFVISLSKDRIYSLPIQILYVAIFISNLFNLKKQHKILSKMTKSLTFKNSM